MGKDLLYGVLAPELWARGWSAIPLDGKRPARGLEGWQRWNERLPDEEERQQLLETYGNNTNTGIAVGPWTVAVDVDVDDQALADQVRETVLLHLSSTVLVRIGRQPRSLHLYRCAPGAVRSEKRHPIEIFSGSGQFAAFGIHPDTGNPYWWVPQQQRNAVVDHDPRLVSPSDERMAWVDQGQVDSMLDAVAQIVPLRARRAPRQLPEGVSTDKTTLPWDQGILGRAFARAGWTRGRESRRDVTRRAVVCPWEAEHSGARKGERAGALSSTIVFGPAFGGEWGSFHCSHAHCEGRRTFEDVIAQLGARAPEALEAAMNDVLAVGGETGGGGLESAPADASEALEPAACAPAARPESGVDAGTILGRVEGDGASPGRTERTPEPRAAAFGEVDVGMHEEGGGVKAMSEEKRRNVVALTAGVSARPAGAVLAAVPGGGGAKRAQNLSGAIRALRAGMAAQRCELRYSTRYQEVQVRWDKIDPGRRVERGNGWYPMDDRIALKMRVELLHGSVGKDNAYDAIMAIADEKVGDDVLFYLEELPEWDGIPRIRTMLRDYWRCDVSEEGLGDTVDDMSERFMMACVARIYRPGIRWNVCLIVQGEQQIGKSSAFRALFGTFYGSIDLSLSNSRAIEAIVKSGSWGAEAEELTAFKKSDIDKVKAFISATTDDYYGKFERHMTRAARSFVVFGTTNDEEFLGDPTGNERFWIVRAVGRVEERELRRVVPQLWAEARARWLALEAEERESAGERPAEEGLWLPAASRERARGLAAGVMRKATWELTLDKILARSSWVHRTTLLEGLAASRALRWDSSIAPGIIVTALKRAGFRRVKVVCREEHGVATDYVWVRREVRDSPEFFEKSHKARLEKAKQETNDSLRWGVIDAR